MLIHLDSVFKFVAVLCMFAAVVRAMREAFIGQSCGKILVTLIGAALTYWGVEWMLPRIRHLVPDESISFTASLATGAMERYAPVATRKLRDWAAKFHELAVAESGPCGNRFVWAKCIALGWLMPLLVGVVNGLHVFVVLMRRR